MRVFVTVGTTKFPQLVSAILSPDILSLLYSQGYSSLTIQAGNTSVQSPTDSPLDIQIFDYKPSLAENISNADLVISHAGAGTCLEVLESKKPLVVIVNDTLMDNHQTELASRLAADGHLVSGTVASLGPTLEEMQQKKFTLEPFQPADGKIFSNFINNLMGVTL